MDVFEAVQIRRSIRAYKPTPIPKETLEKILEAARLAPSAGNVQPWHFIVVTNPEKRATLAKAPFAKFLKKAPVVIVGCGDQKASPKWFMVDVAIAMQNMVLTATSMGLGTCWVGSFDEEKVRGMLKIPERYRVVALLALGYPQRKIDIQGKILHLVRRRRKLETMVSFEEFGFALLSG
ncbi:MAG: nitroreductase family protein [Candidatus Bathyarchaeota archaeon]|nr:nitroreductase family protein [Candidatus Bathyarchaeota archaeon]